MIGLSVLGAAGRVDATHVADLTGDGKVVIACLGDSNTGTLEGFGGVTSWCTLLNNLVQPTLGWQTVNVGIPGGTVLHPGPDTPSRSASTQLATALALPDPPDVVLLAFGTNDLPADSFANVIAAYQAVKSEAESLSPPRRVAIALTPPQCVTLGDGQPNLINGQPANNVIASFNALLQSTFTGPDDLLDFFSPMVIGGGCGGNDYMDCIHMNLSGQQKRAQTAQQRLTHQP